MATPAKKAAPQEIKCMNLADCQDALSLARDLAKFIKDNKLSTTVQGKEFVNVEGWQYAGSRLGIVPVVDHAISLSSEAEIKYQAKVTLFDLRSGQTVGAGFAVCSNKENGRKFYQEYAIMSMAQTRAIGKAFRNTLAWMIRAAGYEPTPSEEMDYIPEPTTAPVQPVMKAIPAEAAPAAVAHSEPSGKTAAEVSRAYNESLKPQGNAPAAGDQPAAASDTQVASTEEELEIPKIQTGMEGKKIDPNGGLTILSNVYATAAQKKDILELLNDAVITRAEKKEMYFKINKISQEKALAWAKKIRAVIRDRTQEKSEAA